MLTQLSIKNFGLIDEVSFECSEHLNILTGETGAGKSIIIGALRFVLGEKIQSSQIRDQKKPCHVEAVFEFNEQHWFDNEDLSDFLDPDEGLLIIQRTYTPEGRSKTKINGSTVTAAQLKTIGRQLIDFHGPHDHQSLLSQSLHLNMLDRLTDFEKLKSDYSDIYQNYKQTQQKIDHLQEAGQNRERDLDLLKHQIRELEQVPLDDNAYEELQVEQTKINNAEKLFEHINQLTSLFQNDKGIDESISLAFRPMQALNQIDESTSGFMDQLQQLQDTSQSLLSELNDYAQSLNFDPQSAQEINDKYDIYYDIQRKYGPNLSDAQAFYNDAKEKYETLNDFEHNDQELREQLKQFKAEAQKIAKKIHDKRQKSALLLKKTIESELKELGFNHITFAVNFEKVDLNAQGFDDVTFFISPNAGEDLKPLAEIVSSGEAARIMLALKKALVHVDPVPVLIFDEIDAQIGGRLGTITGKKLRDIAQHRQVLLITHLPQIASFAEKHFKILKRVASGRSITELENLDKSNRVKELAQMMSGDDATQISIKHAQDLLKQAQNAS